MFKINTDISFKTKIMKQKKNERTTNKITRMIATYENYLHIVTDLCIEKAQ